MDRLTDGILLALFVTATVVAAHKATRKKPPAEGSCKVFFREGDEHPMRHCRTPCTDSRTKAITIQDKVAAAL